MIGRRAMVLGALAATGVAGTRRATGAADRPLVTVLMAASETVARQGPVLAGFLGGLRDLGYEHDRNITLALRFADGDVARLDALALEAASMQPRVIYTSGTPGARAAVKAAAGKIPVVIGPAAEITMEALVANFARPDANVTGLTLEAPEQDAKCIDHLSECVADARRMAVLINPDNAVFQGFLDNMRRATHRRGIELFEVEGRNAAELPSAFAKAVDGRAAALLAANDGLLLGNPESRKAIIALGLTQRMPTGSTASGFARDGGLMTLSVDTTALARRAATLVHRILQGAKPADLPVERPARVVLSINLATARTLGVKLSPSIFARADEVIE